MALTIYGKTVSSGGIAGLAWRSAIDVVERMPILIVSAMLLSLSFGFVLGLLYSLPVKAGAHLAPLVVVIEVIGALLLFILQAPVAVAVHRLILRNETSNRIISLRPVHTRHFLIWLFLFQLCASLPRQMFLGARPLGVLATLATALPLAIFLTFVIVRLSLIFPAVAIEARADGWRGRMRKSWRQTQGHFWLIFWAGCLAALPLIVAVSVVTFVTLHGMLTQPTSAVFQPTLVVLMTLGAILRPIYVMLGAAVLSWTYRFLVA